MNIPVPALLIGGAVTGLVIALVYSHKQNRAIDNTVNAQGSPALGRHRGLQITSDTEDVRVTRLASAQDPQGGNADYQGYPYNRSMPSAYAKGEPSHNDPFQAQPVGYSTLDYGPPPMRIPRLWKDGIRYWDGLGQRGYTQTANGGAGGGGLHLFHARPSYPTRGYRSISGALSGTGPTASITRIPAVFIPSSVS